jgi:hypothetical protein
MIPKSCRFFGQDYAAKQMFGARSRFNLKAFRSGVTEDIERPTLDVIVGTATDVGRTVA